MTQPSDPRNQDCCTTKDESAKSTTVGNHPVGVAAGAVAAGALAGAAGGAIGGPVGAVAGAAIGAVAGGIAGGAASEAISPAAENIYWREHHASKSYALTAMNYDDYAPAYQYGWETYDRRGRDGGSFDSIEGEMQSGWDKMKGKSRLAWDQAKHASREAWNRVRHNQKSHTKAVAL